LYLARDDEDFDGRSLRQGDVLAGIPFPLLEYSKLHVLGALAPNYNYVGLPVIAARTHEHRRDGDWVTVQVPARFGPCAVLTNCCDLEPRGGRVQVSAITLARLRPISDELRNDPERFASLASNRDPRDPENPGYKDYFYLEPHALLEGRDWNVHFNQVVTVPTSDVDRLLERKLLQLDDRTRVKFKTKLAFSLGRINDDEVNAGLENPWLEPPRQ